MLSGCVDDLVDGGSTEHALPTVGELPSPTLFADVGVVAGAPLQVIM